MEKTNKASNTVASLGLVLTAKRKLKLDELTKQELEKLKTRYEKSLYSRACSFFHIPYSQKYLAVLEAIQGSIEWHKMLEYRRELFGRTNCLEIALDNEQLEEKYKIKPELI